MVYLSLCRMGLLKMAYGMYTIRSTWYVEISILQKSTMLGKRVSDFNFFPYFATLERTNIFVNFKFQLYTIVSAFLVCTVGFLITSSHLNGRMLNELMRRPYRNLSSLMLFLYTDLVKYYIFWTLFSVAELPQHKKQI